MANPFFRHRWTKLIAKHPTEWDKDGGDDRWNKLDEILDEKRNGDNVKNHEKERIDKLIFWEELGSAKPAGNNVYHFHPVAFVENIRNTRDCGCSLGKIFQRVRYGQVYGPIYRGELSLASFPLWDEMIKSGALTKDDKAILIAMSANEGNMDSIQSYDSEILTAGAMQKTINRKGNGEFPKQVAKFKIQYPYLYRELFFECGWRVEGSVSAASMHYVEQESGKEYKKEDLLIYLRKDFQNSSEIQENRALATIVAAIKHDEFLKLQINDFIERLEEALNKIPTGYTRKIGEYVKSNLGKATVLDHDVNRPAHVRPVFGESLTWLFNQDTKLSKNPADWSASDEKKLLDYYGPHREKKTDSRPQPMTNGRSRYNSLKGKL